LFRVGVVAEDGDDRVGLVENYQPAVQIGDGGQNSDAQTDIY
jgi:hypothetical protein